MLHRFFVFRDDCLDLGMIANAVAEALFTSPFFEHIARALDQGRPILIGVPFLEKLESFIFKVLPTSLDGIGYGRRRGRWWRIQSSNNDSHAYDLVAAQGVLRDGLIYSPRSFLLIF